MLRGFLDDLGNLGERIVKHLIQQFLGQFSRDGKFTSRSCHVFVDSLVPILEALIKRYLVKERRNKKEQYDGHVCNRCNQCTQDIICARISEGPK
jgi:hypothetical protein